MNPKIFHHFESKFLFKPTAGLLQLKAFKREKKNLGLEWILF